MDNEGSSDSDSGGAGEALAEVLADGACGTGRRGTGAGSGVESTSEGAGGFAGAGVSSTVECFPVVHGGISRNSSKVNTRGLQHFQPV